MKARTGADVGSDHKVLMATPTVKLRQTKKGQDRTRRIDAAKLKVSETKAAFKLKLRNRFQALKEESVEPDLSSFHRTVREAGEKILGF